MNVFLEKADFMILEAKSKNLWIYFYAISFLYRANKIWFAILIYDIIK